LFSQQQLQPVVRLRALTARELCLRASLSKTRKENILRTAKDSIDAALDAALDMTFPASDPVAVFVPESTGRTVTTDAEIKHTGKDPNVLSSVDTD
jgi:hypothetical protein